MGLKKEEEDIKPDKNWIVSSIPSFCDKPVLVLTSHNEITVTWSLVLLFMQLQTPPFE